ncbi:MAG TPA: phage/plasmid primase, P4 family, partial [Candidatus Competibacter sp.]|nr:phage/plasmid primase, P4 family [Candidatus Competibacter sp.]
HPSGVDYQWLVPPGNVLPEPPPALLELWRNWETWVSELQATCPWAKPAEPKVTPHRKVDGANLDVIGQFNNAHDVRAILEGNGYRPKGGCRYLPPNSTSGVPSVRILDSGRVYSSNGSCPLNDGHAHDAFSIFSILEHDGDVRAAVRAAAAALGIELKRTTTQETATSRPPVERSNDELNPYRGTDEANAALFLSLHGADVRYCPPWDKWLIWSGSHWRIDDSIKVRQLAADLPRQVYRDASETTDPSKRRSVADLARKLESGSRQSALLEMAKCRVVVHNSDLDQGRFLLNASNGTIDLKTGKVRNHSRSDLLTHDAAIQYDPNADCPTWKRFLADVFGGDTDLIEFVRRAVGYSLTGDVREQVLLICHGSGSNGKSVFLNILKKLLGRLALQAAPDLLMADRNRRHPTEQADLYGRRAVVCQETEENRRLNEVLVKQLTGGDSVRARRMHEDFWEFEPTWKIWLSTNHRPEIRGTDHAIWRRVRLIPFNTTFHDPGKGDPVKDSRMEEKLTAELPGILAWAVQGCLAWVRDGLTIPDAVRAATDEYREQQDTLAAWLGECCTVKRTVAAKAADLYASYSEWCEANGERPEPQRRFGMRLTERGFQRQRRMVGIWWLGIGLLETNTNERYERNEPDLAVFPAELVREPFIAKSGSYGSYGSCDTEKYPESPPVDDEPAASDALAGELAQIARLDIAKLLAGDLSEADWSRITSATVQLSERHTDAKADISVLLAKVDAAYSARATP